MKWDLERFISCSACSTLKAAITGPLFYMATGITTRAPPSRIATFGQDPNRIPVDDVITRVLVMGGGVVAAAAFLPALIKAPVRFAAAWTYVLAIATVN